MDRIFITAILIGALIYTYQMGRKIRRMKQLKRRGVRAKGLVTKSQVRLGRGSAFNNHIQFLTPEGRAIQVESTGSILLPTPQIGEHVHLLYDPENPDNFMLDTEFAQARPYLAIIATWLFLLFLVGSRIRF